MKPNNINDERYALFFNMMGFGPNCIKGTNVFGSVYQVDPLWFSFPTVVFGETKFIRYRSIIKKNPLSPAQQTELCNITIRLSHNFILFLLSIIHPFSSLLIQLFRVLEAIQVGQSWCTAKTGWQFITGPILY